MTTSTAEENTTGAASISDQAIEKIFYGELELMVSIRRLIDNSSLPTARKMSAKLIQQTKIELALSGMRDGLHYNKARFKGPARARMMIRLCENYLMILDTLLDEFEGSTSQVGALLKQSWTSVRKEEHVDMYSFDSKAQTALYLLFKFAWVNNVRFSQLHSQLTAHLALVEYRLRNGWLIGKYNAQWTKALDDSDVVHAWVNKSGMNLVMEAYRFEIPRIHQATKGQTPTGM